MLFRKISILLCLIALAFPAQAALPYTFQSLSGNVPASDLDTNFGAVGAMGVTQCLATGTNTLALTPTANQPTISGYANYQQFSFVSGAGSTGTVTININSIGALPLYLSDGATPAGAGDINTGAYYVIAYNSSLNSGGGGFQIVGQPVIYQATNFIGSPVSLNNTSNYFDGPSATQGTVGTWCAGGTVTLFDTSGSTTFYVKLWDGTSLINSTAAVEPSANAPISVSINGCLASPAGNIRISVRDVNHTTGVMTNNITGLGQDSNITAIRIR